MCLWRVRQWVSNNKRIAIKETDYAGEKMARVATTRSTEVPMAGNIAKKIIKELSLGTQTLRFS
jgi:hypothetical protein